MNIVYGVSGEGLGHVFEAREVAALLRRDGHAVKILTYGDRACRSLAEFQPTRIGGIEMFFTARGLSLNRTFWGNLRTFRFYLGGGRRRVMREIADFQPDVFITAYEPFTTLAAHRFHRPLISMDNQNELRHLPRPRGADPFAFHLARIATRIVTWGAAAYIVKTFDRRPRGDAREHLVSPIIQNEIRTLRPSLGDHVLVYLTKPNPRLLEVLKTLGERFVVYCQNRVGEEANLVFRAQGPSYPRNLGDCKAIIGTTGFSLIADSIYLKKPYFGVPLKKQFEQTHNAHFLRDSGLGEFSENPSRADLEGFLGRLPVYRERLAGFDLDPAEQENTLRAILERMGRERGAGLAPETTATSPGI
jgi:uncharacterized protein (TIGR00661 family)